MSKKILKCQKVLQEFLDGREWEDEIRVNEENQSVQVVCSVDFGEYKDGRLFIDASDTNSMYGVFFYYPFKCKESKFTEMCVLLNRIHNLHPYGRYELLTSDGGIRWMQNVDFEGAEPSGQSIELMVGPGWQALSYWAETIAAVALTKVSAEEAYQQLVESEANGMGDDAEGPKEL